MVSVQTDMAAPKDFDDVRLEVLVNGKQYFGSSWSIPTQQQIPATFGIVAGSTPGQVVDIRVLARQNGKLRVLREAVTTIPTLRSASPCSACRSSGFATGRSSMRS